MTNNIIKNKNLRSKKMKLLNFQNIENKIERLKTTFLYKEPTIEWDKKWGYGLPDYNGNIAELYAPTDRRGQWKIIGAQAASGKSSLLREYYDTLCYNYSPEEVAVITVGEREREEMWKDVNINFYEISLETYGPEKAGKLLLKAVMEIHRNKKIKAVLLDSLKGCRKIIENQPFMRGAGMETGGLKPGMLDHLVRAIIEPLRIRYSVEDRTWSKDRILITTMLFEKHGKAGITMLEELRGLCNSEIYLDLDIARQGIFPAINQIESISRGIEEFAGETLKRLNRKAKVCSLESVIEAHK